jgi:hypothetical protein
MREKAVLKEQGFRPTLLVVSERKRAIAYSINLLTPGLYIWLGSFTVRLFGSQPDDEPYRYPGVLNSNYGIALVLPGDRLLTTDRTSLDRYTF